MRERLVATAYLLGWRLARVLPAGLVRPLCVVAAELVWRRQGAGVRRLQRNLARVLPSTATNAELETVTRAAVLSYLRYWAEVFRLPVLPRQHVVSGMQFLDEHRLRDAFASGRGVVAALPHMGNWDCAGAWALFTGMPFTTVVERLRPETLFERFVAFRHSIGMDVVPLTGGADNTFGGLVRRLRAGGFVCLMADRDLTATGVEVDFFGEPARFPAGPAALALSTGAILLPVTLWYPPGRWSAGWRGRMHPPVEPPATGTRREKIAAMTQAVADAFAEEIAAHPSDWHMLQRIWLADLDAARDSSSSAGSGDPENGASGRAEPLAATGAPHGPLAVRDEPVPATGARHSPQPLRYE